MKIIVSLSRWYVDKHLLGFIAGEGGKSIVCGAEQLIMMQTRTYVIKSELVSCVLLTITLVTFSIVQIASCKSASVDL